MEVNAKIELLAGLECIATKAMTTLKLSFNHLETIEQNSMFGSALDGIKSGPFQTLFYSVLLDLVDSI